MVTDHRLWGGPNFGEAPRDNDIMIAHLATSRPAAKLELAPRPAEAPGGLPTEAREAEQVARLRTHPIATGGSTLRIFRGDMHRHTDISMDGAGDGSLFDAYRYAMDAAAMDYFLVTDHQSGDQEYSWWRIEKSADMFHVPGYFTAMYGTERSLPYPNGHRNLVFAKRGVPILPITDQETEVEHGSGSVSFPAAIQRNRDIAYFAHRHGDRLARQRSGAGADCRDLPGCANLGRARGRPAGAHRTADRVACGRVPAARDIVWKAWAKGYKLGVQASSDHVSTHTSYSCVLAENGSREALLDAMRKRHTYAATSNILLDYRLVLDGRTYVQGDAAAGSSMPELTAKITGTAPLKRVVVVRDNEYVYTNDPKSESFDLRYRENNLESGRALLLCTGGAAGRECRLVVADLGEAIREARFEN